VRKRQITLISKEAQDKLTEAKVAIIGVGGLGSAAAELLARAGVGKLLLVDNDIVEECNLGRQFFSKEDIGKSKCLATYEKLQDFTSMEYKVTMLEERNVMMLQDYDLVLDCTDNMRTRFLINDNCKKWIYAAAIRNQGYVMPIIEGGPCLRCFLQEKEMESCEEAGVLNVATTGIAVLQVNLALKTLIYGVDSFLYYLNLDNMELKKIKVKKSCKKCCYIN